MKQLLLYAGVNDYSAANLVKEMHDAGTDDLTLRINTDGGDPQSMFAIAAAFREYKGKKSVKIDGKAYSAGLFLLPYADEVTALDVSMGLIHRAAYSSWFESSEYMTEAMWSNLDSINAFLREALESRIDVEKLEKMKGVTIDEIFSNDARIDVFLTAAEMKKVGLVDKIEKITPKKKAEIKSFMDSELNGISAKYIPEALKDTPNKKNTPNKPKSKMTKEEFKSEHSELFAQVCQEAVESERDRTESIMAFAHLDLDKAKTIIASGKSLSEKDRSELSILAVQAAAKSASAVSGSDPKKSESELDQMKTDTAQTASPAPQDEATSKVEAESKSFFESVKTKLDLK